MTIESKWADCSRETQPLSSIPSKLSPNQSVLTSSLPSVKSQIRQWSKMQGTSNKTSSLMNASSTPIKSPSEPMKTLPSRQPLTGVQKNCATLDTPTELTSNGFYSSRRDLDKTASNNTSLNPVTISVKTRETLSSNTNGLLASEENKTFSGHISSPLIDTDSLRTSRSQEFNCAPVGHKPAHIDTIVSKAAHPSLTLHHNIISQKEDIEKVSVFSSSSVEQAASSIQELDLTSHDNISSSKFPIQTPSKTAFRSRPVAIYSKGTHPIIPLIPHTPSAEQKYQLETPQPSQLAGGLFVHHPVPGDIFFNNIQNNGANIPLYSPNALPMCPETHIEDSRAKKSPYSDPLPTNNDFIPDREHKPILPYRSKSVLTIKPALLSEGNDLSINPTLLIPPEITSRQSDTYTGKQINSVRRSKTVPTSDTLQPSIRTLEMQRSTSNSSALLYPNNGDQSITDKAPMVPQNSIPVHDRKQKSILLRRPIPDSYPPKHSHSTRTPNISRTDNSTVSEGRLNASMPNGNDPQGASSGVLPPELPPKPALPQKWANTNFGQYNIPNVDSDSNSDDGGSTTPQPPFPDQTYTNRRAPEFPGNPEAFFIDLQHKNPPKRFSIAGHVVVTGNTTIKFWNMQSQEAHTICHEDSKVSSIAACPSVVVKEEGRRFWCGLQDGTLIEIDTETIKVTNRISLAHSSPVTHILRYKLQLWTMDDNGVVKIWTPNVNKQLSLFQRPPAIQIAKKQQVAIVVRNELWTAKEKNLNIYVYKDNQGSNSFEQIESIEVAGQITCLTKNREGTIVYSGHMDGRVMIWDTLSHNCVRVVPVSNYRICSLLCVREKYLWAGFATGRIYIYDMSYDHWIIVKSWDAHHSSPIIQLVFNSSSIFLYGKMQIASFAEDGEVKIWDGMLTTDWKEKEMLQREAEFCKYRDIKVLICSWNIDASKPQSLEENGPQALENWLSTIKDPEIIIVGFQETVDLESKKLTAKSILKFKNKTSEESWTHSYKLWQDRLTEAIGRAGHQSQYELLQCENLIGLFTCVFVKTSEISKIQHKAAGKVKTGFGGLHGNKGAIAIRLLYENSSFCFVNCHLAAGQNHVLQRNNDVATILQTTIFEPINEDKFVFVKGGNGTLITDHGLCFWSGDLNYRIDLPRSEVMTSIQEQAWDKLYKSDQLHREQSQNLAFMLRSFTEGPIQFAPTYKYDPSTNIYDTSEKLRIPAWCDRILYRGERIQQHSYQRHELTNSDHRPISAVFTATVKTVLSQVEKVQNDVEAAWANYMEKIFHHSMENWLVECDYQREIVKQVLERDYDIEKAALFLNSQF